MGWTWRGSSNHGAGGAADGDRAPHGGSTALVDTLTLITLALVVIFSSLLGWWNHEQGLKIERILRGQATEQEQLQRLVQAIPTEQPPQPTPRVNVTTERGRTVIIITSPRPQPTATVTKTATPSPVPRPSPSPTCIPKNRPHVCP